LPSDPADLAAHESIIRVTASRQGRHFYCLRRIRHGGAAPLQVEFSAVVQKVTDDTGKEISAARYLGAVPARISRCVTPVEYLGHNLFDEGQGGRAVRVKRKGVEETLRRRQWPIDAVAHAPICGALVIRRAFAGSGRGRKSVPLSRCAERQAGDVFGVGIDPNIITASFKALISPPIGRVRAVNKGGPQTPPFFLFLNHRLTPSGGLAVPPYMDDIAVQHTHQKAACLRAL